MGSVQYNVIISAAILCLTATNKTLRQTSHAKTHSNEMQNFMTDKQLQNCVFQSLMADVLSLVMVLGLLKDKIDVLGPGLDLECKSMVQALKIQGCVLAMALSDSVTLISTFVYYYY